MRRSGVNKLAKALNHSILIAAAITISSASVAAAEFKLSILNCVQLRASKYADITWQIDNGTETHFTMARFKLDMLTSDGSFIQDTLIMERNLRPNKTARSSLLYNGECSEIAAVEVRAADALQIKNSRGDDQFIYGYSYDDADAVSFREEFEKVVVVNAYSGINATWISR